MIEGLYKNPENELLLAEYLLATGGVQLGVLSSNLGASNPVVEPIAGGPGGGSGPPCFIGSTVFTLFNGVQIPMAELYKNRTQYIGRGARSFSPNNIIVPGEIRDVFKTRVKGPLLSVLFENEPDAMEIVPEHRFWMKRRIFRPMRHIALYRLVHGYDTEWRLPKVVSKKMVEYPDGVDVYNALIGRWHNYFAAASVRCVPKAVSNAKPPPDI